MKNIKILLLLITLSSCYNVDLIKFKGEVYCTKNFTEDEDVNKFLTSFKDTIHLNDSKLMTLWGSTSAYIDFIHKGEAIGISRLDYKNETLKVDYFKKYSINSKPIYLDFTEWRVIRNSILSKGISKPEVTFTNANTGHASSGDEFLGLIKSLAEEKKSK